MSFSSYQSPASNYSSGAGGGGTQQLNSSSTNNNNNNANGASSTNANYRSKFAGMPGSASALHVHYGFKHSAPAFDPLPAEHPAAVARKEARQWAQGTRLGQKPEWSATTATPDSGGHPRRQLMHQLSEFQAPKLVYNFRAQELPSVHKQAVPVWKPGKFKVDQTGFLSKKDRQRAGHIVLGNTDVLSHAEMPITEDPEKQRREAAWSNSTALPHERASLFVKREEADYRALNRTKPILDHDRYVNPIEDVKRKHDQYRELKRHDREEKQEFVAKMKREARARRGLKPASLADETSASKNNLEGQVFKMSNIDTWWNLTPPELQEAVDTIESRRLAEDDKAKKEKDSQDANRTIIMPTNLKVVTSSNNNSNGNDGNALSMPPSGR